MPQYPFTEINLGKHTLILLPNGSLELADSADPISYGLSLSPNETRRLYACLQAQFQPPTEQPDEDE